MKGKVFSVLAVLAVLFATACQQPTSPGTPGVIDIEATGISIDVSGVVRVQVGDSVDLNYTITPSDATSGLIWSSSDTSVVTISATGKATAVAAGSSVITLASADDPNINGECTVEVFTSIASFSDFTLFNQPDVGTGTTDSLSNLYDDKLYVTNTSTDGNVNSSAFNKNSIVHYNSSLSGDFRFQARILIQDQVDISSNRGVFLGFMAADGTGAFDGGESSKYAFLMKRNRGDVVTFRYKTDPATGNESRGSSTFYTQTNPDVLDEYIYEIQRAFDGTNTTVTFRLLSTKDGSLIAGQEKIETVYDGTAGTLSADFADGNALFPVIIANGATAVVSNIKLWSGASGSETLVFDTSEVAGSYIHVSGVSVSGTERNSTDTYEYQNSLAGAMADTISVSADVAPALADDRTVTWSSSNTDVATVDVSGNIDVTGAGDVVITARTNDSGFTGTYSMHITPSDVQVSGITVSGSSDLMEGLSTTLSAATTPSDATDQTVTWSSSDETKATVDSVTGVVTAVAMGSVTITATANDGSLITGTHNMTIKAAVSTLFSWIAGTDADFDLTAGTATEDGYSMVQTGGSVLGDSDGLALNAARFLIGSSDTTATTSADTVINGELNFAQAVTVTVNYEAGGTGTLNLYINNNTASSSASPLGGASKLNHSIVSTGGSATYSIDPASFTDPNNTLSTAFIQLRTDSSSSINITSIMIAYD